MPAHLYINTKGQPVFANSYSSSSLFRECPTKYKYNKKLGWRERDRRAATQFGVAWESAVQFYHQSDLKLGAGLLEWKQQWEYAKSKALVYKDTETWEEMFEQGSDLLRLYAVRLPKLPIVRPQF